MLGAVVEKNGDHTMARFHLATTAQGAGLYQQALEHYSRSRGISPRSVEIFGQRPGRCFFYPDLGRFFCTTNLGRTRSCARIDPADLAKLPRDRRHPRLL